MSSRFARAGLRGEPVTLAPDLWVMSIGTKPIVPAVPPPIIPGFSMLDVLLESRGVRTPRPLFEATLSVLAHGAMMVLIIVGPSRGNLVDSRLTNTGRITPPEYLVPPDKSAPPREQHVQFVAVGGNDSGRDESGEIPSPEQANSAAATDDNSVVAPPRAQLFDDAYSILDVDSAAARDPSSAAPSYPPAMMSLLIEGAATIKFVVDATGRVDLGTVQTVTSTNPAFAHAVIEALPKMRFRPAHLGAVAVRQMAQEEFKFEIKRLAKSWP